MKRNIAILIIILPLCGVQAQQVNAEYLNPIFSSSEYKYTIFGTSAAGYGGILWNNTSAFYGDGDDFGIYTYNNRDMILHSGAGKLFINASKVGIGTHVPQAKLHIPNGDIIVGGMEGVTNTLNSSLFIKSRADNSSTYPLYVGKYSSGSDLFWIRGEGDAFLSKRFGIGTAPEDADAQLQVMASNNPTILVGSPTQSTGGKSTLKFSAGTGTSQNAFSIQYSKNSQEDRLDFIDGSPKKVLSILNGGNVGIGCETPAHKLTVKGTIQSEEVKVELLGSICPDYVFEKDYNLLPLSELEAYIKANKHLPEVPSAKEFEANGLNLKEMNLILLKKVEELTLHLIEANRKIEKLNSQYEEFTGNTKSHD